MAETFRIKDNTADAMARADARAAAGEKYMDALKDELRKAKGGAVDPLAGHGKTIKNRG